jgi:hypothetical protein
MLAVMMPVALPTLDSPMPAVLMPILLTPVFRP